MKSMTRWLIGGLLIGSLILVGCDRPLPTDVSQNLTQAAPTIEALMGTATTIASQVAATLAQVQMPTGAPLTVEAFVNDLSSTAEALQTSVPGEYPGVEETQVPAAQTTPEPYPQIDSPTIASPAETESLYLGVIQTGPEATQAVSETEAVYLGVIQAGTEVSPEAAAETALVSEQIPETSKTVVPAEGGSQAVQGEYKLVIPDVYHLKRGEFPYCLARRFDIHPNKLMRVNGFFNGQQFYPGQAVIIPASARPFPGNRALRRHPATHWVSGRETIYSIACTYGDIDPMQIAWLNGLTPPYKIYRGQGLILP